ncbi:acyl-CoA desaturase [Bradyrhizobium sp. 2TAF24]|uniref:acyl-CoA desaturase n=1 Tax=Bradyrhizobium sp. 2TAF24 TaxID=3233011 RepID=UPI003F919DEB
MPGVLEHAPALPHPEGALPIRLNVVNAGAVAFYHAVAALAVWPALFSWSGVVLAALGTYVFGTLGINLCYHRLLTHRGLVCPKWLEHSFAILGVCCFQDTPARWVAVHRRHHEHSDAQADPHSPLVSFLWAHMEWVYVVNRDLDRLGIFDCYAKDILRDRFYVALERKSRWLWVIAASWAVFFVAGLLVGLVNGQSLTDAAWFGASWLVWGVFVRTVVVWHITWSVNSVAHLWGYRSYATADCSRNNVFVGLLSNGEGWHNNHHADSRAARHGHRAGEIDVTWCTIWALEAVGLATRVIRPSRQVVDRNACESEAA